MNLVEKDTFDGNFLHFIKSSKLSGASANFSSPSIKLGSGSGNTINGSTTLVSNIWYHFTSTYEKISSTTKVSLYLNGILDGQATFSGNLDGDANEALTIGGRLGSSYYFNGQISDVRIYNTVLTSDQVNELYQERSSVYNFEEKNNLKLHLPLNHSLKDISGNGYNGSFFGGNPSYVENYKGDNNGALSFDGVDDYVDMGHIPVINFQRTDNFTINCWVNVDGISGSSYEYNDFLGQMYSGSAQRGWYIQQHLTYLYLTIRAGSSSNNYQLTVYPNGFSFTVGVWTHLSVVFTG